MSLTGRAALLECGGLQVLVRLVDSVGLPHVRAKQIGLQALWVAGAASMENQMELVGNQGLLDILLFTLTTTRTRRRCACWLVA